MLFTLLKHEMVLEGNHVTVTSSRDWLNLPAHGNKLTL